jgi:hypothetical protein
MSEKVLTVGGARASRPISDFLMVNDYQGPKAGKYYVDLNVAATGGGSPDHPYATLAEAITASNTSIGLAANRWWARRNQIFVCGDGISEDLTVLPEKCDIIGCGSDLYPFPRIIGHHVIAAAKVACRFINIGFQNDDAGPLLTIPAGCHGLQILGGLMLPKAGGSTKAVFLTDTACVVIDGVNIGYNIGGGIFAEGITVEGTIGHEIMIKNNDIYATEGIHVAATSAATGSIIKDNEIYATAKPINDESSLFRIVRNNMMTTINIGTTTDGYTFNLALASGNKLTGLNGLATCVPFEVIAE